MMDAKAWLGIDDQRNEKKNTHAVRSTQSRMGGFKSEMTSEAVQRYKKGVCDSVAKWAAKPNPHNSEEMASESPDGDPVSSSSEKTDRDEIQRAIETIISETIISEAIDPDQSS